MLDRDNLINLVIIFLMFITGFAFGRIWEDIMEIVRSIFRLIDAFFCKFAYSWMQLECHRKQWEKIIAGYEEKLKNT